MTDGAEGQLADQIAAVVLRVPGVAGLHTGSFGEVATYLPGRRVEGIQVRDTVTEVHASVYFGAPVLVTAEAIRTAVRPLVDSVVNVSIEDVVEP